jgi:hypothetical protein
VHASTFCIGCYFAEISGVIPPTDTQHTSATLEVFLGCW